MVLEEFFLVFLITTLIYMGRNPKSWLFISWLYSFKRKKTFKNVCRHKVFVSIYFLPVGSILSLGCVSINPISFHGNRMVYSSAPGQCITPIQPFIAMLLVQLLSCHYFCSCSAIPQESQWNFMTCLEQWRCVLPDSSKKRYIDMRVDREQMSLKDNALLLRETSLSAKEHVWNINNPLWKGLI